MKGIALHLLLRRSAAKRTKSGFVGLLGICQACVLFLSARVMRVSR